MPDGLLAFIIVIGAAAVIGVVSFVIYRILNPKLKQEEKSEEERAQEALDRILVPVEDEEAAKEISSYKEKEDE